MATFLAVRIEDQRWTAMGIGDCNLFVVSPDSKVRLSVPAQTASEFGTSPSLVPSMPGPMVKRALQSLWRKTGKWKNQERMIVCTDAAAAYLLYAGKDGGSARRFSQLVFGSPPSVTSFSEGTSLSPCASVRSIL